MLYEENFTTTRVKTIAEGVFVRNLNEAYNRKHEQQKQAVKNRLNMLVAYLKETGDKNVLHIQDKTKINIYTLRRDLRKLGYHTQKGFIV